MLAMFAEGRLDSDEVNILELRAAALEAEGMQGAQSIL
jgi:hypothetical protein